MSDESSEPEDGVSRKTKVIGMPAVMARPIIDCMILDLDGVLLDNRHECYSSVRKVLDHYGVGKDFTEDRYRDIWGGSIDEFWKSAGIPDKVSLDDVDKLFWKFFYKTQPHKLFKGTGEALCTMASKELIMLGLVTAAKAEYVDEFLGRKAFGARTMRYLFKCIRPNCRNGKKRAIHYMASVLGVNVCNTAYVDDSPQALQEAGDIGAFTIGMLEGHASEERIREANPEPRYVNIKSPVELVSIVRGEDPGHLP